MTGIVDARTRLYHGFLLRETHGTGKGRDTAQLGASHAFFPGLVLGRVAATGRVVPLDLAGADGSEMVAGIALFPVTTGPDVPGATFPSTDVLVRDATVAGERLVWPAGATPAEVAAGLAQLAAAGVVSADLAPEATVFGSGPIVRTGGAVVVTGVPGPAFDPLRI